MVVLVKGEEWDRDGVKVKVKGSWLEFDWRGGEVNLLN